MRTASACSWLFGAAWMAAGAGAALAQATTGAVEGRIAGPDGGALPGVTVTAAGALPGSRVAVTDGAGAYHLAALPPGSYEVRVELQGFAPQKSRVIVSLDATTRADFRLAPALAEEVTVRAAAPLIDPDAVEISDTVPARAFEQLPLSRDYTSVALLEPGVTLDNGGALSPFAATPPQTTSLTS